MEQERMGVDGGGPEQCGTCRHWTETAARGPVDLRSPRQGSCRGAPPQIVIMPGPRPGTIAEMAKWPTLVSTERCGAYERRTEPPRGDA